MTRAGHWDVIIVGAGPVGLFLGNRLAQRGGSVLILEREPAPRPHSRSIGIHPPSLERLEQMRLAGAFLERGARITTGRVFGGRRRLGALSFAACPGPYRFVLTLPQNETERILESALRTRPSAELIRGASFAGVREEGARLRVEAQSPSDRLALTCSFLVGCDGSRSSVRAVAGIPCRRFTEPDAYLMGDFADRTAFGADACITLHPRGLVESFPLPGGFRRWVIQIDRHADDPDAPAFCGEVARRTGERLSPADHTWLSGFRVHRSLADDLVRGRVSLAGDAAHEMSPFGGQGMNVGWLDAWDLAEALISALKDGANADAALATYNRCARRRAIGAIRRATWNMKLGRGGRGVTWRQAHVRALLHSPARHLLARAFTLRWL